MPQVAIIEHVYISPGHTTFKRSAIRRLPNMSLVFVVYVILVIPQANNGLWIERICGRTTCQKVFFFGQKDVMQQR